MGLRLQNELGSRCWRRFFPLLIANPALIPSDRLLPKPKSEPTFMRFFAYILGFLILIGGLAWGAVELGAPQLWVMIGSTILLGIGIIMGASRTRIHRPGGDVTVVRDNDQL